MSASFIFNLVATTHLAVTGSPAAVPAIPTTRVVRVFSNRNAHVSLTGDATQTDFPIAPNEESVFAVPANAAISLIKSVGETDGEAWVSDVQAI